MGLLTPRILVLRKLRNRVFDVMYLRMPEKKGSTAIIVFDSEMHLVRLTPIRVQTVRFCSTFGKFKDLRFFRWYYLLALPPIALGLPVTKGGLVVISRPPDTAGT